MNYLDTYYRALLDYRKNTTVDHDCSNQRATVAKTNAKADEITIVRKICTIETDWIDAISEGLVHVEKAIKEERQFIRSNGEVIDIEKVKNVSKDSVEHLSKHSNLITRYEEGEDIIPDRLYTVERLSDYAVYENRFLYMMLCYLRDFISIRYNKILDLEHTYNGSMSMTKNIAMPKRNIDIEIKLKEEKRDDAVLKKRSELSDIIVRIRDNLELVHAYLNTPLMQEVGKVPMLKPPVTKTNVLRMNHNFRGALALYEYISAYDRDGYSVSEETQKITPFKIDTADEFSEVVLLASFLTYEHGLGIKDELKAAYDIEEERRKRERLEKELEKLKALRRRIAEEGVSPEEYMVMLEKRNRILEKDSEALKLAREEIEQLKTEVASLTGEKRMLSSELYRVNTKLAETIEAHKEELIAIDAQHRADIASVREEGEEKLLIAREEAREALEKARAEFDERVEVHREEFEQRLQVEKDAFEAEKATFDDKIRANEDECKAKIEAMANTVNEENAKMVAYTKEKDEYVAKVQKENAEITEHRRYIEARLIGLRAQNGLVTPYDDYSTEEAFMELEAQMKAFKGFFKNQWGSAKKQLRKNVFADFFASLRAEKTQKTADKQNKKIEAEAKKASDAQAKEQAKQAELQSKEHERELKELRKNETPEQKSQRKMLKKFGLSTEDQDELLGLGEDKTDNS